MTAYAGRVLLVEDDAVLRLVIERILTENGYQVGVSEDGQAAWELLESGAGFDTILLDREMPRMNGMELLRRLKASAKYNHIPVVMETGLVDDRSAGEAIELGAQYYLTKPLKPELMLSVVSAAVAQYRDYLEMQDEMKQAERPFALMSAGFFYFSSLEEARMLASFFARACPEPQKTVLGLQELFINAVEHGNLGISYADKSRLLNDNTWEKEILRRLALPEFSQRRVSIWFERARDKLHWTITDEGEGFDWSKYLEFDPERAFDAHGRGIAMARRLSLDGVEYMGNGNIVVATVYL